MEQFRFRDDIWATLIYEYAVAFHKRTLDRKHLLQSLTPLYLGKVTSFVLETQALDQRRAEDKIEELCRDYEQIKTYLARRWEEKRGG
jgi:hypothetical protein